MTFKIKLSKLKDEYNKFTTKNKKFKPSIKPVITFSIYTYTIKNKQLIS